MSNTSTTDNRALKRKADRSVSNEATLMWPMLSIALGFLVFYLQMQFRFSIFGTLGLPPTMLLAIVPSGLLTLVYYYISSKAVQKARMDYEAIQISARKVLRKRHLDTLKARVSKETPVNDENSDKSP